MQKITLMPALSCCCALFFLRSYYNKEFRVLNYNYNDHFNHASLILKADTAAKIVGTWLYVNCPCSLEC